METKQNQVLMSGLKESLGYDEIITIEPIGVSGGLAVMWKNSYEVEVLFADKWIIDLRVKLGSFTIFLSCVYDDPIRARRYMVWD